MRVLSLFSGAGGLDRGLEAAGLSVVGMCERDAVCRSVLARHWPDVPVLDDVTTLDGTVWRGRVDLVVGGSPCVGLSLAGRRRGLDDERSALFWHQCRIFRESAARWMVWENVAGALVSNDGNDFAAVLWGFTGVRPGVPADGWRSGGVCVGVHHAAVWRVLDAEGFGTAQRRRRVFVVVGPRSECGPEVLLEPERGAQHPRPDRTDWEPTADRAGRGTHQRGDLGDGAGGVKMFAKTHRATNSDDADIWREVTVAPTLTLHDTAGGDAHQTTLVTGPGPIVRRVSTVECERLMGWEDGWTGTAADGSAVSDNRRRAMCGNGVASPTGEWIGRRLRDVFARTGG